MNFKRVWCRQTKPEINISFAVCRVLNKYAADLFVFAGINWGKSGTRIRYQNFNTRTPIGIAFIHIKTDLHVYSHI